MGLFKKRAKENRTLDEESLSSTLRAALLGMGGVTEKEALNIPSLTSCVEFIANKVAELPVKLYKESGDETIELKDDERVRLLNDTTGDLLDVYQLKHAVVKDYLLYGAGYLYPERRRNHFVSLRYIKNSFVSVIKNSDPIFKKADYLVYDTKIRDDELVRVLRSSSDGVSGVGVLDEANELLTVIYRSMIFEKYLVANGGNKKGFLKSARKLDNDSLKALAKAWKDLYSNNGNNMMVLNDGIDFKESSNTSVEMQLNENKKANNDYVCEIFNLSSSVVSGAATDEAYTGAIKSAVMPVIRAFEAALNQGLLLESERHTHYFAFDTTELLKGDILKRYQAYQIGLQNNFLQPDEVRYKEDLKPLGFNFIRLGLESVLLDPKTNMIYTPNTNQTTMFGQSANTNFAGENEVRYSANQPKDDKGRFAGNSVVSGNILSAEISSKALEKANKSGIIRADISIGKSLGAAAKNYSVRLPDGNHTKFAEGTKITKIRVFAGKGTNTPIRDRFYLESTYGIKADKWQKVRGEGTVVFKGKNRAAELHWYEAEGEKVDMKVKRWLDES